MAKLTKVQRLRAIGAIEGDWPEGSTLFPEKYGFARTGAITSRLHLSYGYGYEATAACGVGIAFGGTPQGETLDVLIERELCTKCLRTVENEQSADAAEPRS